jgi:hypothetical protein
MNDDVLLTLVKQAGDETSAVLPRVNLLGRHVGDTERLWWLFLGRRSLVDCISMISGEFRERKEDEHTFGDRRGWEYQLK